jgi:S-sulfo-L-cysteine synthase (O-acetyl-L-serine-dependent)
MAYRFVERAKHTIGSSLIDLIGGTPLVPLRGVAGAFPRVEIYAKLEGFNPGGSIKDRPVLRMIQDAERQGQLLRADGTRRIILDSSSGNAGIAYAMIGASMGYEVTLAVPASASEERRGRMRAHGAELILTDPLEGSDGAMFEARRLAAADPDRYAYLNQYDNASNWRAHYDGTGPEIIAQTHGRVTHVVAGVGTSGTVVGVGRRLREFNAAVEIVAAEPDGPVHGIEGWKHLPTAVTPGIYDASVPTRTLRVRTEDAYTMGRRLAREEGLFVGPSSGAALVAALQVAATIDDGAIVVMFPDAGDRYLSTPVWRSG